MIKRMAFYAMVAMIAIVGFLVAAIRHFETGIPLLPGQEKSVWLVEARVDFRATGESVTVSFSLPEQSPGFDLYQEQAASPGYGFSITTEEGDRRGEWTKRQAQGEQSLYYSAQFVELDEIHSDLSEPFPRTRAVYWEDAQGTAAQQLLDRARATSSSPQSLARELIKLLNVQAPDQNTTLLLADGQTNAELLQKLLNQEGVPSRIVMGLYLEDARRRQQLVPMLEIHTGETWQLYNPRTGEPGVPSNLLLWHRGGKSLLDVTGGRQSNVSFSIVRQRVPAVHLARAQDRETIFSSIGIHRLPVEEQSMFKLLLLLPLGAVVVVFMRVIVGLQTAGTFMPILIALAFLQTSLLPGLISFVSVVGIGLLLRSYLSRLNLLLVARIATLLVLVIFIISALSIIGYEMGYSTGMTITFFPMIIIAWTIERMSILWEEEGAYEVLIQGGGSLIVAIIAYLLMDMALLKHLTFNFPEVNLIMLAAILGMGQYTGYKLSELYRFRDMGKDE
jgi:hypothetical protein